jgi:hypothetical protein
VQSLLAVSASMREGDPDDGQLFDLGPPLPSWAASLSRRRAAAIVQTVDEEPRSLARPYIVRAIWRVTDLRPLPDDIPEVSSF